jgi:micrococcal nuclease
VVDVPDGDSVRVQFVSGAQRTIRYIGVWAPEWDECGGGTARRANARLVPPGSRVRVAFDHRREDGTGELLAYVSRLPGGGLVNQELLEAGAARILTVPPNVREVPRLMPAAARARDAGRGLWRECPDPEAGRTIKDP